MEHKMEDVVIVDAARSAVGRKKGSLGYVHPSDTLGPIMMKMLERNNVAEDAEYKALAEWFRQKLGRIVLGDGRVECDWKQKNVYTISDFAKGADNKKLDIPAELVPGI